MSTPTQAGLVSLGFSEQQALDIQAAVAGNADIAQLVSDGMWGETASLIADANSTAAQLVSGGLSSVQASAIR